MLRNKSMFKKIKSNYNYKDLNLNLSIKDIQNNNYSDLLMLNLNQVEKKRGKTEYYNSG